MKKCKDCKVEKNEEEFYRSPAYKDGRVPRCKSCTRTYDEKIMANVSQRVSPENKICCICRKSKSKKEFYKRTRNADGLRSQCIECCLKQNKQYPSVSANEAKFQKYRYTYGVSREQYEELSKEASGKCCICKNEEKLVLDHCHATMKIRGLLCKNCNAGLGMFGDNTEFLQSAIEYIRKHK